MAGILDLQTVKHYNNAPAHLIKQLALGGGSVAARIDILAGKNHSLTRDTFANQPQVFTLSSSVSASGGFDQRLSVHDGDAPPV